MSEGPYHLYAVNVMRGAPTTVEAQTAMVEAELNLHPEYDFQTGYQWPWNASCFIIVMKDPNWKPLGSDRVAVPTPQAEAQGYTAEEQARRWGERQTRERI